MNIRRQDRDGERDPVLTDTTSTTYTELAQGVYRQRQGSLELGDETYLRAVSVAVDARLHEQPNHEEEDATSVGDGPSPLSALWKGWFPVRPYGIMLISLQNYKHQQCLVKHL